MEPAHVPVICLIIPVMILIPGIVADPEEMHAPLGIFMAGRTKIATGIIGGAVLFWPFFVFLPKLLQQAMKADVDAVIGTSGKNGQVKKIFWTFFIGMAGRALAREVDPATDQQIVGMITGTGGKTIAPYFPF